MGVMNCQWRSGLACAALLLAVSACDNGEDSGATTVIVTLASTSALAPQSTTTVATTAPVTTAVGTTMSPTTAPPATSSPATTSGTEEAAKAAVIAAAIESTAAFRTAQQEPGNSVQLARLRSVYSSEAYEKVLVRISEMVAAGEYLLENSDVAPDYRIDDLSIVVDISEGTASVNSCEVNSWILMRSVGDEETVQDDSIISLQQVEQFVFEDGVWRFHSGQSLNRIEGASGCDGY